MKYHIGQEVWIWRGDNDKLNFPLYNGFEHAFDSYVPTGNVEQ